MHSPHLFANPPMTHSNVQAYSSQPSVFADTAEFKTANKLLWGIPRSMNERGSAPWPTPLSYFSLILPHFSFGSRDNPQQHAHTHNLRCIAQNTFPVAVWRGPGLHSPPGQCMAAVYSRVLEPQQPLSWKLLKYFQCCRNERQLTAGFGMFPQLYHSLMGCALWLRCG